MNFRSVFATLKEPVLLKRAQVLRVLGGGSWHPWESLGCSWALLVVLVVLVLLGCYGVLLISGAAL